jgi:hypothetical protein
MMALQGLLLERTNRTKVASALENAMRLKRARLGCMQAAIRRLAHDTDGKCMGSIRLVLVGTGGLAWSVCIECHLLQA